MSVVVKLPGGLRELAGLVEPVVFQGWLMEQSPLAV